MNPNQFTFPVVKGASGVNPLKVVSGRGAFRLPAALPATPPAKPGGDKAGRAGLPVKPPAGGADPKKTVVGHGNAVPGFYSSRYKLIKRIVGGQAVVYKAHDREMGMDVALKFLPPQARKKEVAEELKREAAIAMRLTHENIVRLYTVEVRNVHPFLVMEYVEGETLDQLRQRMGALALNTVAGIASATVSALAYAHERGVIHRDLKPGNIMVTVSGHLKVLDFGSAANIGSLLGDYIEGTPGYMAPEQVDGTSCDCRVDVFALGAVLWEMLTGWPAFPNREDWKHMYAQGPVGGDLIPGPVREVLLRALARECAQRWASVREFGTAFELAVKTVS